jgi:hypothetical protein
MSKEIRQQIAQQISKYRGMVFNIVDKSLPPFSYTVGLQESFNYAEIIISGLEKEDAHAILNDIGNGIAEGIQREENVLYDDILDDRPCYFKTVLPEMYEEYLGRAVLYYENSSFPVLQCVWPDQDRQFPDDKGYDIPDQEILYKQQ